MAKKEPLPEDVDTEEMGAALVRSGYLVENQAAATLDDNAWIVSSNYAYSDADTGKSREADLHAYRSFSSGEQEAMGLSFGKVILAECIKPPQPLVFIEPPVKHEVQRIGFPRDVPVIGNVTSVRYTEPSPAWLPVQQTLKFATFHPSFREWPSTQWCSFMRKKQHPNDWMALHPDETNDDFKKLCHSTLALQNGPRPKPSVDGGVVVEAIVPVLVVAGTLLLARENKDGSVVFEERSRVTYRRSLVAPRRPSAATSFLIEVTTLDGLPTLLQDLEKAAAWILGEMEDHAELLRESARRQRSHEIPL